MASLSWPWEPLEPKDSLSEGELGTPAARALRVRNPPPSESEYDAEEADNPTQRMYDEMNRDIEPQMEEWRPER